MTLGDYFASVLVAARLGHAWAWEAIYRDLAGPVLGYAKNRGANDPEDVASETFLQVARNIHRFEGDEVGFRSWVFTIAHRRVIDQQRAEGRQPEIADGIEPEFINEHEHLANVEREAMSNMSLIEVRAIIRVLSAQQRDVILLRVIGDFSVAETARILDKSEGAVRVTQTRALQALRDGLMALPDSKADDDES